MKYKIYYKGDICKIPGCVVNLPTTYCSVENGGSINLDNGDVLYINEEYGPIVMWGDEYYGISLSLESGNEFFSILINTNDEYSFSSMYGLFFDLDDRMDMYYTGNILKIYDLQGDNIYDACDGDFVEYKFANYPCSVLVLTSSGNWKLTTDAKYAGNTIAMGDGEKIYVSGPSFCYNEVGIYFTLDSGKQTFSFYIRDGESIQESYYGYFGGNVCVPEDGDIIHIYEYTDDTYSIMCDTGIDFSDESNIAELCRFLYSLRYNGRLGKWVEFNRWEEGVSVENGGQFTLVEDKTLTINPKMGYIDYEDDYGIKITVSSGENYICWIHTENGDHESSHGVFYDFGDMHETEASMYADDVYINIYLLGNDSYYDYSQGFHDESYLMNASLEAYTLRINDDKWELETL